MALGRRMRLLLLRMMTWSGLLDETLDTCTMRASKSIDDQTDINNEMDLISMNSPTSLTFEGNMCHSSLSFFHCDDYAS